MKIKDGIKYKGQPFEIPDCDREDLPKFFKEMGYKVGVEIGVYQGRFTRKLANAGLKVFGVDPYMPYKDFDIESDNRIDRQETIYQNTVARLAEKDVVIIRKTSMDAVNDFEDESLDFIYIDGNHKFKYVAEDICEWAKKIRKGGCISGHDYIHPGRMKDRWENMHVKFVVDAYTLAFQIKNWFVLGEEKQQPGHKRDMFRSWLWIKE